MLCFLFDTANLSRSEIIMLSVYVVCCCGLCYGKSWHGGNYLYHTPNRFLSPSHLFSTTPVVDVGCPVIFPLLVVMIIKWWFGLCV